LIPFHRPGMAPGCGCCVIRFGNMSTVKRQTASSVTSPYRYLSGKI
jgi:hypothetical protein